MRRLLRIALALLAPVAAGAQAPEINPRIPKPSAPIGTMEMEERDSLEPPPGVGYLVRMRAVEGLPADSAARTEFLLGFRSAFAEQQLATERPAKGTGEPRASLPATNRFRLLEGGGSGGGTWEAQVAMTGSWSFAALPARTAADSAARDLSTTIQVTWWALTPRAAAADARPIPRRERIVFRFPEAMPERFVHAGRQVALLVLEHLHHLSGDLDEDTRLRLEKTTRQSVAPR